MHNPNLKVLMFGWELPPHNSGGLGVACYGLTKSLASNGVGIAFALPRPLPHNVPFMEILPHQINGVEITAINSHIQAYMTSRNYCDLYANQWQDNSTVYGYSLYEETLRYAKIAEGWSRTKPHHIIHAHDWMTYPAALRAKHISGRPLIAHIHATEYDRTGGNVDPKIADIEYQGLSQADQVIAVSDYTRRVVHDKYCVPLERITVVHNGIDPVEFSASDIRRVFPHDKIVLYVGRLTFQKGVDYFLRSALEVLANEPNTVFVVAGSGDMERNLIMQAAQLGIGNRVIFAGFMQGQSLNGLYQMSDVFVMPSVSEPYGLVALEAAGHGVPAIISKQSGVSETLDHVSKVDFWDTHKMANEIIHLLRFPRLAQERARHARKQALSLTWDKAAVKTMNVYQSLLG
jgi:glycogen synthase